MTLRDGKTLSGEQHTAENNSGQMFSIWKRHAALVDGQRQAGRVRSRRTTVCRHTRAGGNLTLWTITGEHLYGALIALDDNSMSWGLYMSGDCKNIVSFAGGSMDSRFYGVMYALTLDEDTPLE